MPPRGLSATHVPRRGAAARLERRNATAQSKSEVTSASDSRTLAKLTSKARDTASTGSAIPAPPRNGLQETASDANAPSRAAITHPSANRFHGKVKAESLLWIRTASITESVKCAEGSTGGSEERIRSIVLSGSVIATLPSCHNFLQSVLKQQPCPMKPCLRCSLPQPKACGCLREVTRVEIIENDEISVLRWQSRDSAMNCRHYFLALSIGLRRAVGGHRGFPHPTRLIRAQTFAFGTDSDWLPARTAIAKKGWFRASWISRDTP